MELYSLRRFDIEILRAKGTKGIEVWFWCHSQAGLQKLRDNHFVSDTLTSLFQCISPSERSLSVPNPPQFTSNLRQFEKKVGESYNTYYLLLIRTYIAPVYNMSRALGIIQWSFTTKPLSGQHPEDQSAHRER